MDVSPEEALEAAWRAGEVQTMQAETESVEPQPDNMSDLDETELAESLQMLGRNGAPDIVQGQDQPSFLHPVGGAALLASFACR